MNRRPSSQHTAAAVLAALILSAALVAHAGAGRTNAPAGSATNPVLTPFEIPASVFVLPAKADEGRDPFFPASIRPYGTPAAPKTTKADKTPQVEVQLNGISVSGNRRVATINQHAFEAGDETEIVVPGGRIRIRCIEVKDDSAVVEVNGERRELRLKRAL